MNIEDYKEKKLSLLDKYTELIIGAKTPTRTNCNLYVVL